MPTKADWKRQAQTNAATIVHQGKMLFELRTQIESLEAWLTFERTFRRQEAELNAAKSARR